MGTKAVVETLLVVSLLSGALAGRESVGGKQKSDTNPVAVEAPLPALAAIQLGCKRFGTPIVRFTVTEEGDTESHKYVRRTGCLQADRELLKWLKKWKYTPAMHSGKPMKRRRRTSSISSA